MLEWLLGTLAISRTVPSLKPNITFPLAPRSFPSSYLFDLGFTVHQSPPPASEEEGGPRLTLGKNNSTLGPNLNPHLNPDHAITCSRPELGQAVASLLGMPIATADHLTQVLLCFQSHLLLKHPLGGSANAWSTVAYK